MPRIPVVLFVVVLTVALLASLAAGAQPNPPSTLPCCWPAPCSGVDLSGGPKNVKFTIGGIATATGWGGHFSLGAWEDGYGGSKAECHITGGSGPDSNVFLFCYDGYYDSSNAQNQYEIHLGKRSEVDWAELEIVSGKVYATVQRRANNSYTTESIPYEIGSFFPLRDQTDFWSGPMIHYTDNGVLSGHSGRIGSGYTMTAECFQP